MKILDLRQHDGRYYFRIGKGGDFRDAIYLIKTTFNPTERDYDDDTKEWSVPATRLSEAKLTMIFSNAAVCLTYLDAQCTMF